ncbi:Serine protease, partial [Phytophthora megakarya]
MLCNFVIALTMIPMLPYAFNTSSSHKLNGCAPLCYPGICETPEDVNPMVDIFVKRLPATVGSSDTASNVWLIAGGPGLSSTVMEGYMIDLHAQLEGKVNVYTMDHRGTGRSTLLDCVASQGTTTGSPFGAGIDPSEVPACAEDLQIKYGDLASFSITTAATDLATFISKYTNGRNTIVYGVSYGTVFVERLMHLAPPEVTGYVLDSSMAASGAPGDEFPYFSNYDIGFEEVGASFLSLCEKDNNCHDRFQPSGLNYTHQSLLEKFKNDSNSTCAQLFLTALFPNATTTTTTPQDNAYNSGLQYNLLLFSEMWESPMPPKPELKFAGGINYMIPQYCAFSKENSKDCIEFNNSNYDAHGIVYKRDQYWNKTATIPSQASVLLLSGTLDPQTPPKYAEQLFKALKGTKKELIKFDY